MLLAAEEDNRLHAGTWLTAAAAVEPGFPLANLLLPDRSVCKFKNLYRSVASASDRIDLGGGTASLTPGDYYELEFWKHVRDRILAVPLTGWTAYRLMGSTTRGHGKLNRTAGAADTLLNGSGANAGRNALVALGGYRPEDRASSTTHVSDFPAFGPFVEAIMDLGSAQTADASFVFGLEASASAVLTIGTGSTSAASDDEDDFGDAVDDGIMLCQYEAMREARYVRFKIANPRRTDPHRLAVAYWWHGPVWDTARLGDPHNFEVSVYAHNLEQRSLVERVLTGQPVIREMLPGESFRVGFPAAPGVGRSQFEGLRQLFLRVGSGGRMIVAADPTYEPHRETRLVRLKTVPEWSRLLGDQWGLAPEFEVI